MLAADRFPLITEQGRRLLQHLEEHPHAPRFTHHGFNRMTAEGLRRARAFADELKTAPPTWRHGEVPAWLTEFVEYCFRDVPFYRRLGLPPVNFHDLPTTDRGDLNREPWAFAPDSQPLDDLIVYNTSGTTGHPLDILTHPDTLGLYIPLLQAALATRNVRLEGGPERVAITLVCFQKRTYTYATVSALLDQGGFVKVNLNPDEWRGPDDRAKFLNDLQPEIYTGDPVSFAELAKLPLAAQPKALVSTAMTLTPGLRRSLEARFGCPIIDVYSMNESGPIGMMTPGAASEWLLLQPRLYVEILDKEGAACEPGARGEVTLSGGFNPFLPLLRYRTGDFAALEFRGRQPRLVGLEGRSPVVFRARGGQAVNNIDVSIALRSLPISQFNLHQFADGSLRLRLRGAEANHVQAREAILGLFGAEQPLAVETLEDDDKVVQYTADLPEEAIEQNGK